MVLQLLWYYVFLHGIVLAMSDVIYYFIRAVIVIGLVAGLEPEEEVTDVVCDEAGLKDGE